MINVYEDMESINIFDDEQCDQSLFDQSDSEILGVVTSLQFQRLRAIFVHYMQREYHTLTR